MGLEPLQPEPDGLFDDLSQVDRTRKYDEIHDGSLTESISPNVAGDQAVVFVTGRKRTDAITNSASLSGVSIDDADVKTSISLSVDLTDRGGENDHAIYILENVGDDFSFSVTYDYLDGSSFGDSASVIEIAVFE